MRRRTLSVYRGIPISPVRKSPDVADKLCCTPPTLLSVTTAASTLLRQLFPSWEFFDVARLPPTLQLRTLPAQAEPGAWLGVVHPRPRRWWHLFFNPAGTQTLASQTLVERCYTELVELGEDSASCRESLALMTALAENALPEVAATEADIAVTDRWQFRLVVIDDDEATTDVVYESVRFARNHVLHHAPVSA